MRRAVLVLAGLALVLAGCGGGDEPDPTPSTSATTPAESEETPGTDEADSDDPDSDDPAASEPTAGKPAQSPSTAKPSKPEYRLAATALTAFRCAPDAEGVWTATGTIANTTTKAHTFLVTVFVGSGNAGEGRSELLEKVQPEGSANFTISDLPGAAAEAACHVRVQRKN